ncbi:MAG: hypothetical protein QNJ91_16085, partial [Gammaproteobacteria bacterium]|nr:hypothetical protein [Gammaproteobacteria bacterium]
GVDAYIWLMLPLFILVLFLHKMTLQILFVLCLAWAAMYGWLEPLLILLVAIGIGLAIGYRKYLDAHVDITSFWVRNRALLGAHQVKDSSVFGVGKGRASGWWARVEPAAVIVAMCPFLVLPFVAVVTGYWQNLIMVVVGFSLSTTYVPHLRAWGNGRSYIYYVPSLVVLYLLTNPQDTDQPWLLPLLVVAWLSYRKYQAWLNERGKAKDEAFDQALANLRESSLDRVQCIPIANSDEVAWRTGKQVLWGGHGYGFRLLQPYFPVLIDSPAKSASDWNLGAVLVDKRYWPDGAEHFPDRVFELAFENEGYALYEVVGWQPGGRRPQWADDLYSLPAAEAV